MTARIRLSKHERHLRDVATIVLGIIHTGTTDDVDAVWVAGAVLENVLMRLDEPFRQNVIEFTVGKLATLKTDADAAAH